MTKKSGPLWGMPGGKRQLAKRLAAMLPEHEVYVEPFAGAASVLHAKDPAGVEVLSDLDRDIAFAHRAVKALTAGDIEKLKAMEWIGSRKRWQQLHGSAPSDKLRRLHRFLYVTRFSFGKFRRTFDPTAEGQRAHVADRLEAARERLKKVKIMHGDYRAAVSAHDGKNTLFFIDPPYVGYDSFNAQGTEDKVGEKDFDEDAFFKTLSGIKGKFLVTYGERGRFPSMAKKAGLTVKRVATHRHARRNNGGGTGDTLLLQVIVANFDIVSKSLGDGYLLVDIAKGFPNGSAEAGIHVHALRRDQGKTASDGAHRHMFRLPDGSFVATEEDGAHEHRAAGEGHDHDFVGWGGEHSHHVEVNGQRMLTGFADSAHSHAAQSAYTAFDGVHQHTLQLPDGTVIRSLDGIGFWQASGMPAQSAPPTPPASTLAKSAGHALGLEDFVAGAVVETAEGLHVAADVRASLERAVAEHGALPRSTSVTDDRFSSGRRVADIVVRFRSDGEEFAGQDPGGLSVQEGESGATVTMDSTGDTVARSSCADAARRFVDRTSMAPERACPPPLAWESVRRGAMPPRGVPMMPRSMQDQIPEHLRFWKLSGRAARDARDALFDSGFADMVVPDGGTAIAMAYQPVEPDMLADVPAAPATLESFLATVAKGCAAWEHGDPPADPVDSVVVIMRCAVERWAREGRLEQCLSAVRANVPRHIVVAPDAPAFVAALERPLRIRRSFARDIVFETSEPGLSGAPFAEAIAAPVELSFESLGEFLIGKGADGRLMLDVDGRRFILQHDPREGVTLAAEADPSGGAIDSIIDQGAAKVSSNGPCRVFRLMGAGEFSGTFSARPAGTTMWSISSDADDANRFTCRIVRKREDDEERYVLGVVMEPESRDSHGDIVSAEEIKRASRDFMIRAQRIGIMHRRIASDIALVDNFIAPHDMRIGGQVIKKGSWLMGLLVFSDKVWSAVKSGEFTGLSIGGTAFRAPERAS